MRLINADELADNIAVLFERNQELIDEWLMNQVEDAIDEAPTIEAVQVVRCKDCKYSKYKQVELRCCIWSITSKTKEDGYCYWGEKMEEDEISNIAKESADKISKALEKVRAKGMQKQNIKEDDEP